MTALQSITAAPVGRTRLADLVERLTNGYVGQTRDIYTESGVPYLLARHVRDGKLQFDGQTFVSAKFNETHSKSKLKVGDVLLVQSGHIGHTAVVGSDHDGHNCHAMIVMTPKRGVLIGEYLSYYFSSPDMQTAFAKARSGSTVPHLTCGVVRELLVPVPPIVRQRQIVCQLEEITKAIATAKVGAERNLTSALELLTIHSARLFVALGTACRHSPLEAITTILNGYAFKSSDFSESDEQRCIKITNVGVGEFVAAEGARLPMVFAEKYSAFAVAQGSIVLAMTRTVITGGLKVALVPHEYEGALLNQRVVAITVDPSQITIAFPFSYLASRQVRRYVEAKVNTLMQPNLSITDLRHMPVPVPPIATQVGIVESLSVIGEEIRGLVDAYRRKLTALDELKKSLLHQAFSGAL